MHKPVKPGRKGGCRGIQGDRKLGVAGYDVGHLGEAQSKLKSFPHPWPVTDKYQDAKSSIQPVKYVSTLFLHTGKRLKHFIEKHKGWIAEE